MRPTGSPCGSEAGTVASGAQASARGDGAPEAPDPLICSRPLVPDWKGTGSKALVTSALGIVRPRIPGMTRFYPSHTAQSRPVTESGALTVWWLEGAEPSQLRWGTQAHELGVRGCCGHFTDVAPRPGTHSLSHPAHPRTPRRRWASHVTPWGPRPGLDPGSEMLSEGQDDPHATGDGPWRPALLPSPPAPRARCQPLWGPPWAAFQSSHSKGQFYRVGRLERGSGQLGSPGRGRYAVPCPSHLSPRRTRIQANLITTSQFFRPLPNSKATSSCWHLLEQLLTLGTTTGTSFLLLLWQITANLVA